MIKLLSIIIPVYNEEKIIEKNLKQVIDYFKKQNLNFELIVVNNASTDKTLEILNKFNNQIKVMNIPEKGKGIAIKNGLKKAQGDWILFFDIDLSTPLREFKKFIEFVTDYDIIIGSRALNRSLVKKRQAIWKEYLGRLGNTLIRFILSLRIKDTQCGFKLFSQEAAKIFEHIKNKTWGFDFEFLFLADKKEYRIKEIAVEWINRQESKVDQFDYLKTFFYVFKIKSDYLLKRY